MQECQNILVGVAFGGIFENFRGFSAKDSICPKGWMLSTNDGHKSFDELISVTYDFVEAYSVEKLLIVPLSFVGVSQYSGRFGDFGGQTASGYYLSSQVFADYGNFFLSFSKSSVVIKDNSSPNLYNKHNGRSVRCGGDVGTNVGGCLKIIKITKKDASDSIQYRARLILYYFTIKFILVQRFFRFFG